MTAGPVGLLPAGLAGTSENMRASVQKKAKKKRGRPATGRDPVTAIRLPEDLRVRVEGWAAKLGDTPSRSEAIRRLIEIGLAKIGTAKRSDKKSAAKAAGRTQSRAALG